MYLQRTFPEARFIFIHRSPIDVVNSQIRTIRSVLAQRNEYLALIDQRYARISSRPWELALGRAIYSERLPLLVYQVTRNVARNCDYVLHSFPRLGSAAITLTYRELCSAPGSVIHRVLKFLGLFHPVKRDYTELIRPRRSERLPEVVNRCEWIEARTADYCRTFGV